MLESLLSYQNPDLALLFLRLGLGLCMIMHGIAKLRFGVGFVKNMLVARGLPGVLAYGAYVGEFVAPIMLILGIYTQIAAFILFGNCLVILFVAHPKLFELNEFGGFKAEIPFLYVAISLALMVMGGGQYALIG